MNIPMKRGKSSLAYVTNEERKLLRRRDAVKGSPDSKITPQGLPRLEGGGGDLAADRARAADLREKEAALKEMGFTPTRVAGGETKYVSKERGLSAGYVGAPSSTPVKYGTGADEIFKIPGMKSVSIGSGSDTSTPATTSTTTTSTGGGGSSGRSRPAPPPPPAPAATSAGMGGVDYAKEIREATIDKSQLQLPDLEEIVQEGASSEVLENRLKSLINKNNPLFRAASTKALQSMAARGLFNSSIAEESVMNAILSVAVPIAQRDADAFMQQRLANQNYSNEFKAAQNQAYYQSFLSKLQGSIDMALRQLAERSANWRAVLNARTSIATQPGISAGAAEAAIGSVTPLEF